MAKLTAADVAKLTVPRLREALAARGLESSGPKAALSERLRAAISQPAAVEPEHSAYARLHALYQLCRFVSPPQPTAFVIFQAPFVLAALVFPSNSTLAGSALANVLTILVHLPAVVDMDHWALHTDVGLLALMAVGASPRIISGAIRHQMAIFYAAAGLWKATADHADPRLSCSSLMLMQIMCGWLPEPLLQPPLLSLVAHVAPHLTLLIENLIPLLLALSSRRALHRLGVLVALALHLGITIAPLPLSISDFGVMSASRLAWVLTDGTPRAVAEVEAALGLSAPAATVGSSFHRPSCAVVGNPRIARLGLAVAVAVAGAICAVHGSSERIVAHAFFCAFFWVVGRAIILDSTSSYSTSSDSTSSDHTSSDSTSSDHTSDSTSSDSTCSDFRLLRCLILGAAFFYSFAMPMLGLIDVSARQHSIARPLLTRRVRPAASALTG